MNAPLPNPELTSAEGARCAIGEQRLRVAEYMDGAARAAAEHGDPEAGHNIREAVPAVGCQACQGQVSVDSAGGIVAPNCRRVGAMSSEGVSCDLDLMRTHPDLFTENGVRVEGVRYQCGATVCTATVEWKRRPNGSQRPHLEGTCQINEAGKNYRRDGKGTIARIMPEVPGAAARSEAIPKFDGEL